MTQRGLLWRRPVTFTNAGFLLAYTKESLIEGGVTTVSICLLENTTKQRMFIGEKFFKDRFSPRGVVYLFRRQQRGRRGGWKGGIRAISKGGRNTAIFIRAAGMQSRMRRGENRASRRGGERWRPFWGQHFFTVFFAFFAQNALSYASHFFETTTDCYRDCKTNTHPH